MEQSARANDIDLFKKPRASKFTSQRNILADTIYLEKSSFYFLDLFLDGNHSSHVKDYDE